MAGRGPQNGIQERQRFGGDLDRDWNFADRLGDMISAHAPNGTYRYASAAARDLLGYEPEELVGTWVYDYFHPDDVPKVGVAHRSLLKGAPITLTYRLRHRNGGYVWVETTNRAVTDDATGEVVEILCCTREVGHREDVEATERKREARLRRIQSVLANEAIEPVFQPIVALDSGRTIAFEALSRFPGDVAHTADRWFDDAWRIGLGIPLELLAARIAAAVALPCLPAEVGLSLNVSPPTVAADGFLQCLGGSASRIVVEITEHLHIGDYETVRQKLSGLREAGGQIAIDDFGAGYASLQHILEIGPEWIKLDISLTHRIARDPVAQALAGALVAFAERTGVRVVAEGVEAEEQLRALRDVGIGFGQGFHIGRPQTLKRALRRA